MPLSLKEHIASLKANNSMQLNTVWVSCEGENPADQENIGPINYMPRRGFPGYFYPFENSEGYLSPLVAVHFVRPRSKCRKVNLSVLYQLIFHRSSKNSFAGEETIFFAS